MMFRHCFLLSFFLSFFYLSCTKDKDSKLNQTNPNYKIFPYSRSSDPKTIDPQAQFDEMSGMFVQSVYDTLLSYHYLKRPYELKPLLLAKMPEMSSDGKTLNFELKKNIFFQDDPCFKDGKGRELISDDVIYTIKRFADININTQSWFLLDEVVEGLDAFRTLTQEKGPNKIDYSKHTVSGLKKIDSHRFSMTLKQKNPLILYSLAASSLSIIAKEAVEKYGRDFGRHPVGTGPFRLKEFKKKQTMVLYKNPNYFDTYPEEGSEEDKAQGFLKDAKKQLPLLDEIQISYIPESQPEMLKFKKGELWWVGLDRDNFVQMAYLDKNKEIKLKDDIAKKYTLYTEPALSTSYMVFNLKDPVIGKNKDLRKAIAYAIDIEKKIELLTNGRGYKLYTIVPPSIPGSERDISKHGYDFNLDKAKEHLKKAGYTDEKKPLELTLTLSGTSTNHKNYFEFIRNSLSKIGIILKADYKTWPSFLKATEIGDFQISGSAWAADYPDPENFYQLLYGPNKPPGQNSASFENSEYDKLYEEIRFMPNSSERFEKLKNMAQILKEEVPVIFDNTPISSGLIQKWLLNFKRNIMISRPFQYLNVDQQLLKTQKEKNS